MSANDPKRTFLASIITPVYTPSRVIDCLVMVLARLASDAVLPGKKIGLNAPFLSWPMTPERPDIGVRRIVPPPVTQPPIGVLVLAPTRWTLRRAVKAVNEVLGSLRLEKHPDKTFIGRIERGFDFLGYHFSRDGLRVAKATIEKFIKRASRLYEQKRVGAGAPDALGMYVRRWVRWVWAGLGKDAGKKKSAAPPDRCIANHEARRNVRQQPSAFCASQ